MLITQSFVLINLPKTGSSFVRNVLKQIHDEKSLPEKLGLSKRFHLEEFITEMVYNEAGKARNRKSQHAIYSQIPEQYKYKPAISITRNPFDQIVSVYEFKFWKEHPWFEPKSFIDRYPDFPNFDFKRFLEFYYDVGFMNLNNGKRYNGPIGTQSLQFLKFYCRNPDRILEFLDQGLTDLDIYKSELADIHFLHMENLNKELIDLLLRFGYPQRKLKFIQEKERENVSTNRKNSAWQDYYDDNAKNLVLEKEKLLFELFPEYKIFR